MFKPLVHLAAVIVVAGALFAAAPLASARSAACDNRVNNTHAKLLECVTLEGVREHQAALQEIADDNGNTRVSGSPGYDLSAEYAAGIFRAAGYNVTVQEFQFQTFVSLSPSVLQQVAPPPGGPIPNNIMSYSGSGDVTASVTHIPADATPGCEAGDFAGFPGGNIALVSRGACAFAIKATNAYDAGAVGVVVYNNIAGPLNGTLGNTFTLDIPVTGITQAAGQQLAATPGLVLRLQTETLRGIATTSNVFAESRSGDPNNVVMVGAHLDSVNAGPGINDNGSGTAAILEVAQQMAKVRPRNKVRFALWGAEESNLVGSTYYVNNLNDEDLAKIALYLNFDMIGSPNHVFFVYDGDNSDGVGAGPGPAGSTEIEDVFERFYLDRGIPYKGTDFSGRSDYGPFIAVGIPSGGLFTGAEGIKTDDEAELWGGTAGIAYDPCYHQACDTYANNNDDALETNSDAVAFATLQYAMSTADINGDRGKGNFPPVEPVPPIETVAVASSGGGLHDHDHELATK
jgi:Zn-dependent M28 family amino/carboxypeptidase